MFSVGTAKIFSIFQHRWRNLFLSFSLLGPPDEVGDELMPRPVAEAKDYEHLQGSQGPPHSAAILSLRPHP